MTMAKPFDDWTWAMCPTCKMHVLYDVTKHVLLPHSNGKYVAFLKCSQENQLALAGTSMGAHPVLSRDGKEIETIRLLDSDSNKRAINSNNDPTTRARVS